MQLVDRFKKLFGRTSTPDQPAAVQTKIIERPVPKSILDFTPGDDTTLGVKYTSKYGWLVLPPAGWRRLESASGANWPTQGVSPTVTFTHPSIAAGEQASIRWQLSGTAESDQSHQVLEDLLSGRSPINQDTICRLEAPDLITGMKVQKFEKLLLPTGQSALLISTKQDQCRGEPAVLRHVFLLPDRCLHSGGRSLYFRETVQFVASENSFWSNERLALESLKTFRRATEDQSTSGTFAAINSAPS